jgi:hypothetical protein
MDQEAASQESVNENLGAQKKAAASGVASCPVPEDFMPST